MASSRRAISAVATALGAIVCMLLVAVAPTAMAVPHRSPAPFASVDRALQARVRSDELSGAATVVLGPGDVVLHRAAVGSVHAGTRLPIASASKWLTAAMVMVLVDHHRLSLDDRVATHLPEFQGDKATMTVRELLSHTSGLTAAECVGDPSGTLAECVTRLAKDSRPNDLTVVFHGSNMGNGGGVKSQDVPRHRRKHSISITLPPLAVVAFKPIRHSA